MYTVIINDQYGWKAQELVHAWVTAKSIFLHGLYSGHPASPNSLLQTTTSTCTQAYITMDYRLGTVLRAETP